MIGFRFDTKSNLIAREPLLELNRAGASSASSSAASLVRKTSNQELGPKDCYLSELQKQLAAVLASNPACRATPILEDEAEDPKVAPMVWVSKWVDYSDKYGFGYSLCDDSIGVVFNDLTKLMMLSDGM